MQNNQIKFCAFCAGSMQVRILDQDSLPRLVCVDCGSVHYQNPKILVSCIVTWKDKVLWMKRAQAPKSHHWSIPSGFMEQGETLREAAARELYEETNARIDPAKLTLFITGTISTQISEVYVVFRGELEEPEFSPGPESLDVQLFDAAQVPWEDYAYPEVIEPMQQFYKDLQRGEFGVYMGEYTATGHEFWSVSG